MGAVKRISKSEFKARALEVFREIERSGESRVITDHGKPTLEIRKLRQQDLSPLEVLQGTVLKFDAPTEPVAESDWANA